jgi:sulfite reductase beta subunit-like hemoprotein
MTTEIKDTDGLTRLKLLVERVKHALHEINEAGALEHRRAKKAAEHLEFEIAPLVGTLDVDEIALMIANKAINAYEKERGITRSYLTLATDPRFRIEHGELFYLTARPQAIAMKPERIAIPDAFADQFLIHNIHINNRSQLQGHGPIAGGVFAVPQLYKKQLTMETIQTAMDFVLDVEYVGPAEFFDGQFIANVIGIVAR